MGLYNGTCFPQLKYYPIGLFFMSYTRYCKCHFYEGESEHWGLLDRKAFAHKGATPHYTPDTLVLPEHLTLDLNFDWVEERVWGVTQYDLVIKGHGVEEIEFDHSHIAGGLSKVQTADNVIGIFTSRAMRERGRYQIQFMKTRSSSGVGHKIDLEFDVDTLRIRNLEEEEGKNHFEYKTSAVYETLKQKSKITADVPDPTKGDKVGKIKAEVEGTKLRKLLNELHSDEEQ